MAERSTLNSSAAKAVTENRVQIARITSKNAKILFFINKSLLNIKYFRETPSQIIFIIAKIRHFVKSINDKGGFL
jgi:hypothetical protein